jgi:hypothetical protein
VRRDPPGQPQGQRREDGAVGPDPIEDRLRIDVGRAGRLRDDDPERLPPSELDEDRLAQLEVQHRIGHPVRVRAVAAPSRDVDGDLHETASPGTGTVGRDIAGSVRDLEPQRVAERHGERE